MHDDIATQLYATAHITAVNNQRQHLNRQTYAQGDAESRAFHAERALLGMKQAHENEQREHALTRLAMTRLLAVNIGLRRAVGHLAEKWAGHDGATPEAFKAAVLAEAEATADTIQHKPANAPLFARDLDILREAQRLGPVA